MTLESKAAGTGRVKFENPPINELVIGVHFLPIHQLRAEHIGIYWEQIRERFPECQQQFPILQSSEGQLTPQSLPESPGEVFPLARFWFSNPEDPTLIQVQRNAFWLNWRRKADGDTYPHYEQVAARFWKELEVFQSFLGQIKGQIDLVQRCELSYVNLLSPSSLFKEPSEIRNILPLVTSLCEMPGDGWKLAAMNAAITYRLDDQLLVEAVTKLGKKPDTLEVVALLELRAHGAPSGISLDGARGWFETAHNGIYQCFMNFTSRSAQEQMWNPS